MNKTAMKIVESALPESSATRITDETVTVDSFRLTSQSEIPQKDFLMQFYGKKCFPRKDVTTITGPAKSGKTFTTSMVMACAAMQPAGDDAAEVLAFKRVGQEPLKVMWYDTEQSQETTKSIMTERIKSMMKETDFPDERFFVFNVRAATYEERKDMLPVALKAYKPDIVIIDGIADLLLDINDGPKAIQLMEELLGLSDVYNCNIVTIIHLNRSGEKNNLRGWLGSVMLQKSYEVFNCSKIYQTDILSVEFNTSRHTHCNDKLFYKVNDSGIPFETEEPDTQKRDAEGKFTSKKYDGDTSRLFNQDYYNRLPDSTEDSQNWDLVRLFEDAMAGMASVAYHDMEDRVMKIGNIQHKQYYYRLLAKAEEQGIVRKTYDRSKRIVIIMPPQG